MGSAIETLFRPEARIVQAPIVLRAGSTIAGDGARGAHGNGARAEAEEADDDPWRDLLTAEELAHVRNAVPKRRAEFAAARVCARQALAMLGIPQVPPVSLVPRADRAPTWPAGIVGSISHTSGYCAVVVDRDPPVRALGLDVEVVRPLEEGVVSMILTPGERAWLDAHAHAHAHAGGNAGALRDELVILVFSAKEAFYKCQYGVTASFLEFGDVELSFDFARASAGAAGEAGPGGRPERGRFEARVLKAGWPAAVARLEGKFAFEDGRVLCGVALARA